MPRKPREFEEGGIYHIMNRGVDGRQIFLKNQDYSRFTIGLEFFNHPDSLDLWSIIDRGVGGSDPPTPLGERLGRYRERKSSLLTEILAFALMPNHFHLILREIKKGGISFFMKKMGGYAGYFNKQYNRLGSLLQSRYKAVPVKSDRQLGVVFSYVHTNPVELVEPGWKQLHVKNPERAMEYLRSYQWSSYGDYVGVPRFPSITKRDFFLNFLGGEDACQQEVESWIQYKAQQEYKTYGNILID